MPWVSLWFVVTVKPVLRVLCNLPFSLNKKISVFRVNSLKVLGRVGTHNLFLEKIYNFMHFERHFERLNAKNCMFF